MLALPALAGPVYMLRGWVARRRARRAGAVSIGEALGAWRPLPAADGGVLGPKDVAGARATLFVFMSNRCPGVKAYDERLNRLAATYADQGLRVIGVNSVPTQLYPGESVAGMEKARAERSLGFAYIKDAHQELKRRLGATVTPQAFLLDDHGRLQYRGRIDDAFIASRVTTNDLEEAVQAILRGQPVPRAETHAIGCSLDELSPPSRRSRRSPLRRAIALEA